MKKQELYGVTQFLKDYPGMSIVPCRDLNVLLKFKGRFDFQATMEEVLVDYFMLEISIPCNYPEDLPIVKETEHKIPRDRKHHVNYDGSLCLGSPIRLLMKIHDHPALTNFAENCLVPYLCAVSHKLKNGGTFIYGELRHGSDGIVDDYKDLLGLQTESQVIKALKLLGMTKKRANKKICPCGCGTKLGICEFHNKLNQLREIASPQWFRKTLKQLKREIQLKRGNST